MASAEELDKQFMELALQEARKALTHDDIPVGAVLVKDGKVVGTGKNERELIPSPTAHAELQALNSAASAHGHWNLSGTTLYVTLEPCPMCAGALVMARVAEVVYGAPDPKGGTISLGIPILDHAGLNHSVKARQGPMQEECSTLLKEFFKAKRRQKNTSGAK